MQMLPIHGPTNPRRGRRRAAAAALAVVALAAIGCAGSANAAPRPSAASPSGSLFTDLAAVSAGDAWAVGTVNWQASLAYHWDGRQWSSVDLPNPPGAQATFLSGVAARSSDDVWTVGATYDGQLEVPMIDHWDGTSWTLVDSPDPVGNVYGAALSKVAVLSASNAWAVGFYQVQSGAFLDFSEHWNGRKWKVVNMETPSGVILDQLNSLTAVSADDVWMLGDSYLNDGSFQILADHWNGRAWKVVAINKPRGALSAGLFGTAALSADDIWAVGCANHTDTTLLCTIGGAGEPLVEHWDGHSWTEVTTKLPRGATDGGLVGVSGLAPDDVWAAGISTDGTTQRTLTEHWDGVSWKRVKSPTPDQSGDHIEALSASSPTDAWTVGIRSAGLLSEHWNGRRWRVVDVP